MQQSLLWFSTTPSFLFKASLAPIPIFSSTFQYRNILLRLPIEVFILLFSLAFVSAFQLLLRYIASEVNVFSKHAENWNIHLTETTLLLTDALLHFSQIKISKNVRHRYTIIAFDFSMIVEKLFRGVSRSYSRVLLRTRFYSSKI